MIFPYVPWFLAGSQPEATKNAHLQRSLKASEGRIHPLGFAMLRGVFCWLWVERLD